MNLPPNNNNDFLRSIDLKHSMVHLRSDGIVQINMGDNMEIDEKVSQEMVDAIGKLSEGKKVLVLGIAGTNATATSEGRAHSASESGTVFTLADAFVINSLPQKIIGNFYLNFHKPIVPTKVFDDVEKAIKWLKSHQL